jgi:hypothetical protein
VSPVVTLYSFSQSLRSMLTESHSVCITSIIRMKSLYEISVSPDTTCKLRPAPLPPFFWSRAKHILTMSSGRRLHCHLVRHRNQRSARLLLPPSSQALHRPLPATLPVQRAHGFEPQHLQPIELPQLSQADGYAEQERPEHEPHCTGE